MFLKSLTVIADGKEVRRVPFKPGLNLIVDDTRPDRKKKASVDSSTATKKTQKATSGNNVGKTTLLRCVDFCLGAKPEPIYMDPEFKTPNKAVLAFLERTKTKFVLELAISPDLTGKCTVVERSFGDAGGTIDGSELSKTDFDLTLKQLLFGLSVSHPTLRELMPKFIRLEGPAKTAILRWLPFGKDQNYEAIWLTIFGFGSPHLVKERREIKKNLAKLSSQFTTLGQVSRSPRQELPIILRQLSAAKEKLAALSLEGAYDNTLARLATIRREISRQNQAVAGMDASLSNVKHTLEIFGQDKPSLEATELKELFDDAGVYVSELHATYEQLVEFHTTLLENKTRFVRRSERELTQKLSQVKKELKSLLTEESALLREFTNPAVFSDVRQLSDDIARLSERKGELESIAKAKARLTQDISTKKESLEATEREIQDGTERLEANLELLNTYFTEYSQRLYAERLMVSMRGVEEGKSNISFEIINLEGNAGTGKKKGQIAAFDLAYLRYQQERAARTIRFTMHDEVEVIAAQQLRELFETAESIEGQYVIPVLRDRLSAVDFPKIDECVVVRLSQENRFFGLA